VALYVGHFCAFDIALRSLESLRVAPSKNPSMERQRSARNHSAFVGHDLYVRLSRVYLGHHYGTFCINILHSEACITLWIGCCSSINFRSSFALNATEAFIKGNIDKVASRKLAVTAVAGAAAATGAVEITWPIAAIAMAYILGQAAVDTWGE
jgi:hypothetical protein